MCILVQPTNPCQRTLLTRGPERQLPNLWITVAIIVLIIVLILCSHHFSYPCPHLCSHSHTRPRSNNTFQILMGRGYPFPHTRTHLISNCITFFQYEHTTLALVDGNFQCHVVYAGWRLRFSNISSGLCKLAVKLQLSFWTKLLYNFCVLRSYSSCTKG